MDDRTHCPGPTTSGARRGCESEDFSQLVGSRFELWDADSDYQDEYIGTWIITSTGTQCATFEWENASYSLGEANPDIYVKWVNSVKSGNIKVTMLDGDGDPYPAISWRGYAYNDCPAGVTCSQGAFYLSVDADSTTGMRMQTLDSAQHMIAQYNGDMTADVNILFPYDGSNSYTEDREEIRIISAHGKNSFAAPHELGHVLQEQLFGQDYLRDDCSLSGDGHDFNTAEYESCATAEGWANYVAAASWWDPNNVYSSPGYGTYDFEEPVPYVAACSDNAAYELQVVKAFWDLDDANNEEGDPFSSDDVYNAGTSFIASGWDIFEDGITNRKDYEWGHDGVNAIDYYENNEARFADPDDFYETFLPHNCIQNQDPD